MVWVVPGIGPLCAGLVRTSKSYFERKLSFFGTGHLFLRVTNLAVQGLRRC